MVRLGKLSEVDALSEIGIYGTFLRKGSKIIFNREAGHLVRTKVTRFIVRCRLCYWSFKLASNYLSSTR